MRGGVIDSVKKLRENKKVDLTGLNDLFGDQALDADDLDGLGALFAEGNQVDEVSDAVLSRARDTLARQGMRMAKDEIEMVIEAYNEAREAIE